MMHPREQKNLNKFVWQETTLGFSSSTLDFNPEDILNKSIQFDPKKTNKEKILDMIIEKIPNNDKNYIEHREGMNTFCLR